MRNLQSSEALYLLAGKKYTFVPITQTIGSVVHFSLLGT